MSFSEIKLLCPFRCTIPVFQMTTDTEVWSKEAQFFDSYQDLWRTKLGECAPRFRRNIQQVGIQTPLVVELTKGEDTGEYGYRLTYHRLVEGHHRWALAKALGLETVPIVWLSTLPEGVFPWHLSINKVWADGNVA